MESEAVSFHNLNESRERWVFGFVNSCVIMRKAMGFGQPTCLSVSLPPTHPISLTHSVTLSHSLSCTYRQALVHTHLHSRTQSRYTVYLHPHPRSNEMHKLEPGNC